MKLRSGIWTIRTKWKNKPTAAITLVCTMLLYTLAMLQQTNSQGNPTAQQDYALPSPAYDDIMDPSIHETHERGTFLKKRIDSRKRKNVYKKEFDYFGSYDVEHLPTPLPEVGVKPEKVALSPGQVGLYPWLADKTKSSGREFTAHKEDPKIKLDYNRKPIKESLVNTYHILNKDIKKSKSETKHEYKTKVISQPVKPLGRPSQHNGEGNATHQFKTYMSDYKGMLGLHQEDPRAIDFAKKNMHRPSKLPYNVTGVLNGLDNRYMSASQDYITEALEKLFNMRNHSSWGRFFEAGAYDGEFLSNTLWLEVDHGWGGLLVEPNPESFGNLLKKHRKATSINCCLSTTPYVTTMILNLHVVNDKERLNQEKEEYLEEQAKQNPTDHFWKSSSRKRHENSTKVGFHEVPLEVLCLPLYTLLAASNLTKLHFLSLDVEYVEMGVLHSLPWDKLDIQVLAIEHLTEEDLQTFMEKQGYYFYSRQGEDWIFVSKKYITIK
ncbi:unnamed protein product [Meganyctiphanes norvegica]|uniref:Methyltransferase FkbM domain-containing protein n=1 Tax=Meganyctiphanes norvegica TaxID=48144 RepID=A0AAV2S4A3_MEGNR